MGRKAGTGLTDAQAKHLAGKLKPFHRRFDENGTAMARAWGISQSQMAQILSGRGRGAGVAVLCRIRMHTGISIDDLLGLPHFGPTVSEQIQSEVRQALDFMMDRPPAKRPPKKPGKPEKEI